MFTHKYVRSCLLVALLAALVLVTMVPTVYAEPSPRLAHRDGDSDADGDVDGNDFLRPVSHRHQPLGNLQCNLRDGDSDGERDGDQISLAHVGTHLSTLLCFRLDRRIADGL